MRIVFIFNSRAACVSRWKKSRVFNFAEQTRRGHLSSAVWSVSIFVSSHFLAMPLISRSNGATSKQTCGLPEKEVTAVKFLCFLFRFAFLFGVSFHSQQSEMTLHRQRISQTEGRRVSQHATNSARPEQCRQPTIELGLSVVLTWMNRLVGFRLHCVQYQTTASPKNTSSGLIWLWGIGERNYKANVAYVYFKCHKIFKQFSQGCF